MRKKVTLDELCNPSLGQVKEQPDTVIDYIDISSVDNESKRITGFQTMSFSEAPSRARKDIKKNNILVSTVRPNLNAVAVYEEETPNKTVVSTGFCVLDCKDNVDHRFVFNFCKSQAFIEDMVSQATGASYPAVSDKIVRSSMIPAYSYEEQCQISFILDTVSKIIADRKKELQKLDELIKSRFVELFGDPNIEFRFESHKFKEYALDMTKGPFGSDMKKDLFVPRGVDTYKVYIQANAIQGNQELGEYYISKEYFDKKIYKFEVHPGDYIITCDGTLGKHLKLGADMEKGVISPSLLKLTLDEGKMTKEYFEYIWDLYMLLLMKKEARNACLVHLPSAKVIGEIDIPVPSIELQQRFTSFVQQIHKLKSAVQKSLDETQLLMDSLMQKYFG